VDSTAVFNDLANLRTAMTDSGIRAGADSGDPKTAFAALFEADGIDAGVWRCEPGGWPIVDRPDTEVMLVLSGRARITANNGTSREVTGGDVFVLPKGWTGRWDVLETLEKLYVIVETEHS
jgi:uncharacterized cupin superfamily protein